MRALLFGLVLFALAFPALAVTVELYCEGAHNDGTGAPVLQTHLWLKLSKSEEQAVIELQGPVFGKNTLVVDESLTTFSATHLRDDGLIGEYIILNRQTLHLRYSKRTSPDFERAFLGTCTRYDPKI